MNRFRLVLVVGLLFVLHITLFAYLHPFGVAPDVLLLGAMVGALLGDEDFGAKHGFACGLLVDLMSAGPFGLAAGVYGAVAHGVSIVGQGVDSQDPRVAPVATTIGSFVAIAGYGLGMGVLGSEQFVELRLLYVAGLVAVFNLVMTPAVRRLYAWAAAEEVGYARPRSRESMMN